MRTGWRIWQIRTLTAGAAVAGILTSMTAIQQASAAGTSACGLAGDTVAPVVTGVTLGTRHIDVTKRSRSVKVSVKIKDTAGSGEPSGVKSVSIGIHDAVNGTHYGHQVPLKLASGTRTSGSWIGRIPIPRDASRTVRMSRVTVADLAGNVQDYRSTFEGHATSPTSLSLQHGWQRTIRVTGRARPGRPKRLTKAGHLTALSISPGTVDASKTGTATKVRIRATFSKPGRTKVEVRVSLRQPPYTGSGFMNLTPSYHHRTWTGFVTVRQEFRGDYTAHLVLIADHRADQSGARVWFPLELVKLGFPDGVQVTAPKDRTKPVLTGLTVSPASVDITTGAQRVTFSATATDSGSGVQGISADASPPSGTPVHDVDLTRHGNTWTGTITIGPCAPTGTWLLDAAVGDRARNTTFYDSTALADAGFSSTLQVSATPDDTVAPTVQATSDRPHTITLEFNEGVKNVRASTVRVYALSPASRRFQHTTAISSIACTDGEQQVACNGSSALVRYAILRIPGLTSESRYQVFTNAGAVRTQLTDAARNPMPWTEPAATVTAS